MNDENSGKSESLAEYVHRHLTPEERIPWEQTRRRQSEWAQTEVDFTTWEIGASWIDGCLVEQCPYCGRNALRANAPGYADALYHVIYVHNNFGVEVYDRCDAAGNWQQRDPNLMRDALDEGKEHRGDAEEVKG